MSHDPQMSRSLSSDTTPLRIEQIVQESIALLKGREVPDARSLAIGAEIVQQYIDYLDELDRKLVTGEIRIPTEVMVVVDGTQVRFKDTDDFSDWLAENMT